MPAAAFYGILKSIRYLIIVTLFTFAAFDCFCQKTLFPEFIPPDIRWDNFPVNSGKASQKSTCLMFDRKGFLWSGTDNALYRYDGIRYVEYGVSRTDSTGFAGYTVTCLFEDSDGKIWVGTAEALNRLDPLTGTFKHYFPDPGEKDGNINFIRDIREDKDSILWIRTGRHVYSLEKRSGKFTRFETDSLSWYPRNDIHTVEDQHFLEDKTGNKWFVTNKQLYCYDKMEKSFGPVLIDPYLTGESRNCKVNCITSDKNGDIWIGTDGEGLMKWNDRMKRAEIAEINYSGNSPECLKRVTALLPEKDTLIWVFGNNGFSKYNPYDKKIDVYLFRYTNRTVYETVNVPVIIDQAFRHSNGTIWFVNKEAGLIFRFQPWDERFSLYRTPSFIVHQCLMDQTGSFWFACIRNNIFRLVTSQIPYSSLFVDNTSRTAQTCRGSILEDSNNKLWFLFNRGTYVYSKSGRTLSGQGEVFSFPDGEKTKESGFKDSKGNFWLTSSTGKITSYNPVTHFVRDFNLNLTKRTLNLFLPVLIREDKEGNIWIATTHDGLFRISGGKDKPEHILDFNHQSGGKTQKMLMDFLIDSRGDFWILTAEYLLYIEMPEKKIIDYTGYGNGIFSAFRSNIRVRENDNGNIFILNSRSGLYEYNLQNKTFNLKDIGLKGTGNEYYDLLADRLGRLWVGNSSGITIYYEKDGKQRTIKTPKLQYDLQSYQTSDGNIIYLNDKELLIFNEEVPSNKEVPPVYLTKILINGTDYSKIFEDHIDFSSLKKLVLPFRYNSLTIEFAALNYLNPEENSYRYFMTKRDKDTVMISSGQSAEYKSLPSGKYVFWVSGSNNDGLWNPEGITVELHIRPPWYRSFLAFVLYLLIFTMLLAIYIKSRTYRLVRDKAKLKAEVEAATAELELKNSQLAEIDRIKTHFFTDISHEIRTPLTMILGPLENISKEEMLSSRMKGMIDLMRRNAHRLMHLVNQLLDISRLDAGKMKLTLTEEDVTRCLRMLVYEFLSIAERKHIRYMVDIPDKPCIVWFDRDKVEKIVSNLLSNAFKYTPDYGNIGCIIRVEPNGDNNKGKTLRVNVVDSGPGISKEYHGRIFDRFYRVEGKNETEGYGTGIGLSLVQEFVSLLHGEIKVESKPGKGSDFSVIMPLGKEHLRPDEYVTGSSSEGISFNQIESTRHKMTLETLIQTSNDKQRILIIEDNEDLRKFVKDALKNNFNVLEAENGLSGINTAFTMMPDLIVTDIMMPDLDGIQICSRLKNDERTSHIPVIMLTARATTDDRIEGLRTGADDYMVKPFNMAELEARISNLLNLRTQLRIKYSKFRLSESSDISHHSVDELFMTKVLKIIDTNFQDFSFDVESLCEKLGMSRTHLTRKLKALTGQSPGIIIRDIRLEKATEIIKTDRHNITEIANRVGISNPSNFTRAFKNYYGVSPKDYLRQK